MPAKGSRLDYAATSLIPYGKYLSSGFVALADGRVVMTAMRMTTGSDDPKKRSLNLIRMRMAIGYGKSKPFSPSIVPLIAIANGVS